MKKKKIHNITSSGYKIPEHYFESFETNFFEKLNDKTVINAPENTGFTTPKDYFNTLESKILKQLNDENTEKPVRTLNPRKTFYYVAGIAASIVLMISLVFNKNTITIDSIDTASIENYLYQEEYTNADFASLLKTDELSVTDFIDVDISDETLNLYLEDIDTEDLILD